MSCGTSPPWRTGAWKALFAEAVTDRNELLAMLQLEDKPGPDAIASACAVPQFPLRVPRGFVRRMRIGDSADPLLLQVLPTAREEQVVEGFAADPLGERHRASAGGILRKYRGRVLLVVVGACAVHCRYCFRRHFPYTGGTSVHAGWEAALERIAADPSLEEVILSGGDPLVVDDTQLDRAVRQLARIPHLRRLRVHSRLPVVLPQRVDSALLEWLTGTRLQTVMVVHANHANEIGEDVVRAVSCLRDRGVLVLNQAVLLRGVNDSARALRDLSVALFEAGVLPYYLHLLDRVAGAAHFDVDEATARVLMRELAANLPGYLVPRLVREVPGAPAKMPVGWYDESWEF